MLAIACWICTISQAFLFASPKEWVRHFGRIKSQSLDYQRSKVDTKEAYLNLLSSLISAASVECDLSDSDSGLRHCIELKRFGWDQPTYGLSMTGVTRMKSMAWMVRKMQKKRIHDVYVEAGVWRGGMSIFVAAALQLYGQQDRKLFLADSFQGLPLPRPGTLRSDESFYANDRTLNMSLSVGAHHVLSNFDAYGVPRNQVELIKGNFVDSLPRLRQRLFTSGTQIAILRMDGDMHDSTLDILYNLYELVAVGGFIVIDDFGWDHATRGGKNSTAIPLFGAKSALLDFRTLHGIEDEAHLMHNVDGLCAWFQKARNVSVNLEKYHQAIVSEDYTSLAPNPRLTNEDYQLRMSFYDQHAGHSDGPRHAKRGTPYQQKNAPHNG